LLDVTTRSQTFAHNGKVYQVRAERIGDEWRVGVFDGDQSCGGYSTISIDTVTDMMANGTADPLKVVMDQAQKEFLRAAGERSPPVS
jgi:hypothetical protein